MEEKCDAYPRPKLGMKILIQNRGNGSYLAANLTWSEIPEVALTFENTVRALDFCIEYRLANVHIIIRSESDGSEVRIPFQRADGH
jgi:hypothetical protein